MITTQGRLTAFDLSEGWIELEPNEAPKKPIRFNLMSAKQQATGLTVGKMTKAVAVEDPMVEGRYHLWAATQDRN